jgi:hypothetical protein
MLLRYILIENNSGYIRGDSADFNGEPFEGTPVQYAQALDDSLKEHGRTYELMLNHSPRTTESGYHVYRADDAVPVVEDVRTLKQSPPSSAIANTSASSRSAEDGQDAEAIAASRSAARSNGCVSIAAKSFGFLCSGGVRHHLTTDFCAVSAAI